MSERDEWETAVEWPELHCAVCGAALPERRGAVAKVYAPEQPWIVLDLCLACGEDAAAHLGEWLARRSRARRRHAA